MAKFQFTPAAQSDLEGIWNYTVETWASGQAERYLRDIEAVCDGLCDGSVVSRSAEDIRAGYRKVLAGSHVVFFRTAPDRSITIIRVLHQRMDLPNQLT
jgi:toxin ParE1/3/4